jgi:hypothetical protein
MKMPCSMKTLAVVFALASPGCLATASDSRAAPPIALPAGVPLIQVDWQGPLSLPPGFRNHCAIDVLRGRPYCSDHCGFDYQFYFCTRQSFGCCRVGYGYCDWTGLLRCAP